MRWRTRGGNGWGTQAKGKMGLLWSPLAVLISHLVLISMKWKRGNHGVTYVWIALTSPAAFFKLLLVIPPRNSTILRRPFKCTLASSKRPTINCCWLAQKPHPEIIDLTRRVRSPSEIEEAK